jgi:hypothetical protein
MTDPWAFGWTQVFTLIGFAITLFIAVSGFRTFERWKREKIEEKRIDTAIDALALVYESKFVFDHIRGAMSHSYEWEKMPEFPGDDAQRRQQRGPFYATINRVGAHKDFFDRAWRLQVRCAALFGPGLEQTFLLLQKARRDIEVSAQMLYENPFPQNDDAGNRVIWAEWRATVWGHGSKKEGGDDAGKMLGQFRSEIEAVCRPVVDREFGRPKTQLPWAKRNTKSGGA